MRFLFRHSVVALSLFLTGYAAAGDKLPPQFTLGHYIPADAWLYVHGVDNPERRWIDDKWMGVIQSLVDSGIDKDVQNLVFPLIPAEHRDEVRQHLDRLGESIRAVKWGEMARHEFVFAERISSSGLSYDYVVLMRGARESAPENFKALTGLLEHAAGLSPQVGVQPFEANGVHMALLGTRNVGAEKVTDPFVWLFRKDDVIGAAFSPPVGEGRKSIADDVAAMMSGKSKLPTFAESARFHEALARVETPSDVVSFFDLKSMFGDLRRMFGTISRQVGERKEHEQAMVGSFGKLIGEADVVDYVISSSSTKGNRTYTDEYRKYQADKTDRALSRMCLNRKPFDRFDEFIPKNASSFSLSAGIDIEALYNFAIGFLRSNVPDGEQIVARLNSTYEQIGFEPTRDLFSWWSGETIEVSLPAAVVTPMGGSSDWAMMVRVKDSELASCRVNSAIDWVTKRMQQRGQMLMVSPANCKTGGFREITHPMLAMVLRPVVGVQDDWLVIAKSADTVNKCLAVSKGDAPSILKNDRFREEGLVPEGPVQGLSFEDLSRRGEEWAGAAAAIGMFGGMAAGMMPPEAPPELRGLIQGATGIVAKIAPVLQRIDFYSAQSSVTVREGDGAIRKRTLVTYKRPKQVDEKVAGEAK